MTYKKTAPTTYAIFFEEARLLKVGASSGQRWRNWVARGAVVISTMEFDLTSDAFLFERRTIRFLRTRVPRAFQSAQEAFEFTGIRAGGYSEFFYIPDGIKPISLLCEMPITGRITEPNTVIGAPLTRTNSTYERNERTYPRHTQIALVPDAAIAVDNRFSSRSPEVQQAYFDLDIEGIAS